MPHVSAMASWIEKSTRERENTEVSQILSENVLELRRHYVSCIVDVVRFLSTNELTFRGTWDADVRKEDGLFRSLFEFALMKDPILQKAVKQIPKNATYMSVVIQNEIIECAAKCTQQAIVAIQSIQVIISHCTWMALKIAKT